MRDSNPRPPACKADELASQVLQNQNVTQSNSSRCTPRCSNNDPEPNADPLASFVANLTPADRARLGALLTGQREGDGETGRPELPPDPSGNMREGSLPTSGANETE